MKPALLLIAILLTIAGCSRVAAVPRLQSTSAPTTQRTIGEDGLERIGIDFGQAD